MNRREKDAHLDLCRRLATALAEREAARAEVAAVGEAVKREMDDHLWRKTPCGCGHRADLHSMGGGPEGNVCIGGLTLCGCTWSFVQIVDARLRAALDGTR